MGQSQIDFAALIGSRICHDLISPIGAINNGIELLGLSGDPSGPELGLISESVESASARIRFFRIAYGAPGMQEVSHGEIIRIFEDLGSGSRLKVTWLPETGAARVDVRMVFLALQCLESALPYGGTIEVQCDTARGWQITGASKKVNIDAKLWSVLAGSDDYPEIMPANVQFPLLAAVCRENGRRLHTDLTDQRITIRF